MFGLIIQIFERWSGYKIVNPNVSGGSNFSVFLPHSYEVTLICFIILDILLIIMPPCRVQKTGLPSLCLYSKLTYSVDPLSLEHLRNCLQDSHWVFGIKTRKN